MTATPFEGIRVVELAVVIAGPSAAAMLADWGAEVVKVEPLLGDPQRGNTEASYFDLDNRGKQSIGIDLKHAEGRAILLQLLDRADVFVSNIRTGALERLGISYEALAARNPRLVYGLITGYGTSGPAADKPGYDVGAFWSRAGVAAALAGSGAEPSVPRPGMGDHTAGLALVAGIGGALYQRERTGRGELVTTSLFRSGAYVVSSDLTAQLNGSEPRVGLKRAMNNPLLACYQAADGAWFWLLGLQPQRHWPNILRAVGRQDLIADQRFDSFAKMIRNSNTVIELLDTEFAKRPLDEWVDIFASEDVWWDPVQDLQAVLDDPVLIASGAIRSSASGMPMVGPPVDFGAATPPPVAQAPQAGQHTEAILIDLGYDWDDIERLKQAEVVQ